MNIFERKDKLLKNNIINFAYNIKRVFMLNFDTVSISMDIEDLEILKKTNCFTIPIELISEDIINKDLRKNLIGEEFKLSSLKAFDFLKGSEVKRGAQLVYDCEIIVKYHPLFINDNPGLALSSGMTLNTKNWTRPN